MFQVSKTGSASGHRNINSGSMISAASNFVPHPGPLQHPVLNSDPRSILKHSLLPNFVQPSNPGLDRGPSGGGKVTCLQLVNYSQNKTEI